MDDTTSTVLLQGLRDHGNHQAWEQFEHRYRTMLWSFCVKLGLQPADAQDAAQEAITAFIEAYQAGRYDREKGRLRSWLFGIAHRKAIDIRRRRGREVVVSDQSDGSVFLGSVESPDQAAHIWEQEWQAALLRACMDGVRREVNATTFEAFELQVLHEQPVAEIAGRLAMTPHAVHCAKSRVLDRIRKLRVVLEETW
jgi:RNA polymerase sigma-70 factor, ECF subfamily